MSRGLLLLLAAALDIAGLLVLFDGRMALGSMLIVLATVTYLVSKWLQRMDQQTVSVDK